MKFGVFSPNMISFLDSASRFSKLTSSVKKKPFLALLAELLLTLLAYWWNTALSCFWALFTFI